MAVIPGARALLGIHRSGALQHSFGLITVQLRLVCPPRRLCSARTKSDELNPLENESLLQNLSLMGVDVKMARQRQPGVFRKSFTNEKELSQFLQSKGASYKIIASIISRYPRAITRSIEHLHQRWDLWRSILQTDSEIVTVLERSPESFFRSSDNGNLEKNIAYLASLGLNSKALSQLLHTAPRTFSNSLDLNRRMVECLEGIWVDLGGNNPKEFVKTVLSRNSYILIRSTKRVKTNIHNLKTSLKLNNSELLALLGGPGTEILDLSNEYLKRSFNNLNKKMDSHGCQKADVKKMIIKYPIILYIGPNTLNSKLDCLLRGGIKMQQIVEKPKVLDYSIQNIAKRLEELQKIGYDFQKNGISILDSSQKRFVAMIEKLGFSPDE